MEFVARNLTFPFSPHCNAGGRSQRFGSYHRPFLRPGSRLVSVQTTLFHPRVAPGSPKCLESSWIPCFIPLIPISSTALAQWDRGCVRRRRHQAHGFKKQVCCLAGCYLLLLSKCLFLFNTNLSQNILLKNLGGFQKREKLAEPASGQALQLPFPGKRVHGKSLLLGRCAIGYYFISLWNNSS